MITARAVGVLMEIASKELYGGAKALSEVFVEGRDACQKSLNELKAAGLTCTTKQKFSNGAYRTIIEITPAGWEFLESRISKVLKTRALCIQTESYSRLSTNSLYANKQEIVPDEVGKEEFYKIDLKTGGTMDFLGQMDFDEEDRQEQLLKDRQRRKSEYQDAKQQKHEAVIASALNRPRYLWSPNQSSSEFIKRLEDMWHVKPWTISEAPFRSALANARKAHDTNGEIECLMMDRYLSQISHETSINSPEHIWKRFIQQFGSLAIDVKRAMVTDDDLETAKVDAEKSWEGI